jgi:hypothetical protein
VSKLSQAAAIRGEELTFTRNGFPARNERHATQQEKKKQRRKLNDFKILLQEMMQAALSHYEDMKTQN